VVLEDDATLPPSVASKTLSEVQDFLESSASYVLLETQEAQERLGHRVDQLVEQCDRDLRCWTRAVDRLGVDLLIHVAIGFSGSREQAWLQGFTSQGPLKIQAAEAMLPRGGGAPIEALINVFLEPAALRILLESGTTHLQVNGVPRLLRPAKSIRLSKMPPGKHEILLEGLGLPPRVEVVTIFPGKNIEIPLRASLPKQDASIQKWWGAWAGGTLFITSVAAILAGSSHKASAWR
jgi:hypothetical protein